MTEQQLAALQRICERYGVAFDAAHYWPQFDLPAGYVAGWVGGKPGTIYVGCSPDGAISS
jgi:hypothetical protein